jgi:SAM-dependent methyltransferase
MLKTGCICFGFSASDFVLVSDFGFRILSLSMDATPYLERYRKGEWRDRIFRDMILDDVRPEGKGLTFLDIGCGHGFDGDVPLQESLARVAGAFIGIEPDTAVRPLPCFTQVHACLFEDAPLAPGSIDVAYAIMVLEHLAEPQRFWDKLHAVLAPGGVFWGLTVDSRHWFCRFSRGFDRLGIKDVYLRFLIGRRGQERYENYPVFYRSNSPEQIAPLVRQFHSHEFHNFARVGQCNGYFPAPLRPFVSAWDRRALRKNRPGTLLAVRVQK